MMLDMSKKSRFYAAVVFLPLVAVPIVQACGDVTAGGIVCNENGQICVLDIPVCEYGFTYACNTLHFFNCADYCPGSTGYTASLWDDFPCEEGPTANHCTSIPAGDVQYSRVLLRDFNGKWVSVDMLAPLASQGLEGAQASLTRHVPAPGRLQARDVVLPGRQTGGRR